MSDKHQWFYRWEPGRIIGLSRVCLSSRGLFHVLFDIAFQRGCDFPSTLEEAAEMSCTAASSIARAWGGLQGIRCEAEIYLADLLQKTSSRSKTNSVNRSKRNSTNRTVSCNESVKVKVKVKSKEAAPKETLAAILEDIQTLIGDYEATGVYWTLMGFWDKDKNQAPTQTAKALRDALRAGATIDEIFDGAKQFRASVDDPKFMTRPLAWLQNEGWMTYAANQ